MGRTTKQYKEIEKVKETIQKYIDGANGDLKVLKEAYNEKALINGAPIEALFRSVEHYGETHATARIDYLDISGIAGVAKVIVEDWHGQDYVEYLQLLKETAAGRSSRKRSTATSMRLSSEAAFPIAFLKKPQFLSNIRRNHHERQRSI